MHDLRLIGVHEDGQYLLLADAEGARFRVPLDDALRAAARRDRARLGQLQIEIDGGLRPREVQAMIRRGLSTEEVADRAGWTVEKVRRFEGPVLAEREYVARTARECAVGSRGSGPVTLSKRVAERLRDRGVDRDVAEWDSARDEEGVWSLMMTFPAGGRQRTATWSYEPLGGSVTATNDEARWMSEEAAPSRVIPTPHRADGSDELDVYDLDADGGIERQDAARPTQEPIDLMAAMREHSARGRRGRRRSSPAHPPGEGRTRHDALPLEDLAVPATDVGPPPAARGRNTVSQHLDSDDSDHSADATDVTDVAGSDGLDEALVGGWPEDQGADMALGDEVVEPADAIEVPGPLNASSDAEGDDATGSPYGTDDSVEPGFDASGADAEPDAAQPPDDGPVVEVERMTVGAQASADEDDTDAQPQGPVRRSGGGRKGRPSVPSWDDIVFGTRGGGPA